MFNKLCLLFLISLCASCTSSQSWYTHQGFNISKCGVAVATMICKKNSLDCTSAVGSYWTYVDFENYFLINEVRYSLRPSLEEEDWAVALMDETHWVYVQKLEETIRVFDPLFGEYYLEPEDFSNRIETDFIILKET